MPNAYVVNRGNMFMVFAIANEPVDLKFLFDEETYGVWFDVHEPQALQSFLKENVPAELVGPTMLMMGRSIGLAMAVFEKISHLVPFQILGV